jgi:hypothetical protein
MLMQTLTPNVGVTPTPEDWHNWTNYWSFHVPWPISLLCVLAFFAMSWPDIKYSGLFKYVGYTEGNPLGLWDDDFGFFTFRANIIATAAIGLGLFIVALVWYSPLVLFLPLAGLVRLIYGYTKLKKDIDFRSQKQKDFLALLSKLTDSSDDGLALFFTEHYRSFDWGTEGDKIFQKGDRWTYKLFPFVWSGYTDQEQARTALRRSLYNLSLKPSSEWLPY